MGHRRFRSVQLSNCHHHFTLSLGRGSQSHTDIIISGIPKPRQSQEYLHLGMPRRSASPPPGFGDQTDTYIPSYSRDYISRPSREVFRDPSIGGFQIQRAYALDHAESGRWEQRENVIYVVGQASTLARRLVFCRKGREITSFALSQEGPSKAPIDKLPEISQPDHLSRNGPDVRVIREQLAEWWTKQESVRIVLDRRTSADARVRPWEPKNILLRMGVSVAYFTMSVHGELTQIARRVCCKCIRS